MNNQLKDFFMINYLNDFLHNYNNNILSVKNKKDLINFLKKSPQKINNDILKMIAEITYKDKDYFNFICQDLNDSLNYSYRLFLKEYFLIFNFESKNEIIAFTHLFINFNFYSDDLVKNILIYEYDEKEKYIILSFFKKQENYFLKFNEFNVDFRINFLKKFELLKSLLFIYSEKDLNIDILNFIKEKIDFFDENEKYSILIKNIHNIFFKNGSLFKIEPLKGFEIFNIFIYDNYYEFLKAKNFDSRLIYYIEKEHINHKLKNF